MAPTTSLFRRNPILSPLARTRVHAQPFYLPIQPFRAAHSSGVPKAQGGQVAWGAQFRKLGGVAVMYFPVVAVVMFWPAVVPPVVSYVEARF